MVEIYKQIFDYDYEFSNYGNIRSMKTGHILKHCKNKGTPLCYVQLMVRGVRSNFYIHQLLCIFYRDGFEKCDYSYEAVMELCELNKLIGKTEDENNNNFKSDEKNIYRIKKNKNKNWKVLIKTDDYKISKNFYNLEDARKYRDEISCLEIPKVKTEREEIVELEKELQALINN